MTDFNRSPHRTYNITNLWKSFSSNRFHLKNIAELEHLREYTDLDRQLP